MWTYWRDDFAEYGSWTGNDTPSSGLHFHDEQQLTFVMTGCRLFQLHGERVEVRAGSCLYLPAGYPHASLPEVPPGTRCLNLYINNLTLGERPKVLTFLPDAQVEATTLGAQFSTMAHEVGQGGKSVAQQAIEAGISREAFTRRFVRLFGMPPHAHSIVGRLNDARRQLRSGASPADVAAACGFYDQTHLTRHFFRVFGATPGAYRKSVGRSQTYER